LFKPAGELEAARVLVGLYPLVRLAALHPDLLQEPLVDKLRDHRVAAPSRFALDDYQRVRTTALPLTMC
jgi:hypothetical protein